MAWVNGPGDTSPQTPLFSKQTSWPADEWHHTAFVYDGSECKLYVDGKVEDSLPRDGKISILAGRNFAIGGSDGGNFFKGAVDEVRYYSRALNAGEIFCLSGLAVEAPGKLTSIWGAIKSER